MRNFRVLSMLLLVTPATLGFLITSCGSDGDYTLGVKMSLDCAGKQRTVQDVFKISIQANGENITISPGPDAGNKLLDGTGTMTSSAINFHGKALYPDLSGGTIFQFSGRFEGEKKNSSYEGIVSSVTGTYERCEIISIHFSLDKY